MLHKKSQKETGFIALSFICMAILTLIMTQINQQKEKLEEEKKDLEEETSKLDSNLTDKITEVEKLSESLVEKESKVEQLQEDKEKLNSDIKESDKTIKKKNDEIEGLKQLSSKKTKVEAVVAENKSKTTSKTMSMEITAYTAFCDTGCIGITAQGTNVKNTVYHPSGHRIVAVDPSIIPLGTILEINGETYIADDTGGDIKGSRLDLLVSTKSEALTFGRQNLQVKILD